MTAHGGGAGEGGKSARKSVAPGRPFTPGDDPRRGRGPEPGAPNAGRPPDWLRAAMRQNREEAVAQIAELLAARALDPDQLIKVVEKFGDDPRERQREPLRIEFVNE